MGGDRTVGIKIKEGCCTERIKSYKLVCIARWRGPGVEGS